MKKQIVDIRSITSNLIKARGPNDTQITRLINDVQVDDGAMDALVDFAGKMDKNLGKKTEDFLNAYYKRLGKIEDDLRKLDHTSASIVEAKSRPIDPEKAAMFIDNAKNNVNRFKNFVKKIEDGFNKAKSDLEGLRKVGVGDTEAVTLFEGYIVDPVEDLQEMIDVFFKVISRR